MKLILTSLILLHILLNCDGLPDGAPLSACSTLVPFHSGVVPSKDKSPYVVSAIPTKNNKVKVTISTRDYGFQGFILQARSKTDPSKFVSGRFTANPGTKAIDCFNKVKGTLTHASKSGKIQVVTEWIPDPDVDEDVIFRATVVKSYNTFWTELDSQPISIHSATVEAIKKEETIDPMYKDCFVKEGCFGLPKGCLNEKPDCQILLTYYSVPNGVHFSLHGYLNNLTYMAVGLSVDAKMGEDSVNECIRDNSKVIARESWNVLKSNTRTKDLPSTDYDSEYSDGLSSCSWVKPYYFESDGAVFDLVNNSYHLLLATGEVREGGGLAFHSDKIASQQNFNLTIFEDFKDEDDPSIEIDGIDSESNATTSTEKNGDVSTSAVTNYTEHHDESHGSRLSFNAFYVILALLLAGRGVRV